jgi:hypothetical protein
MLQTLRRHPLALGALEVLAESIRYLGILLLLIMLAGEAARQLAS